MFLIRCFITFIFLIASFPLFAHTSVSFFASNNSQIIQLETAYQRLIGKEQSDLQDTMINIMQSHRIEQGKFVNILGAYQMQDKQLTADNSVEFITSPYQDLSEETIKQLAKELAVSLHQESVMVFLPNQSTIAGIKMRFISHEPTVNQVVVDIREKLPEQYQQAYSLRLTKNNKPYEQATVNEILWFGKTVKIEEVLRFYPSEDVQYEWGEMYLVTQSAT